MAAGTREPVVAYRGGQRFTETYDAAARRAGARSGAARDGGVYWSPAAPAASADDRRRAGARHKAKLVLTQRTPLPAEWRGLNIRFTARTIGQRRIRQVECCARTAPSAGRRRGRERRARMRDVIDQGRAVRRAARRVSRRRRRRRRRDQVKTRAIADGVLVPKVKGLLVLDSLLRDLPLDFIALFSSIAAVTRGFGQVDYCGANSFLDVFAAGSNARRTSPVVSINWDAWSDVGMAVETVRRPKLLAAQLAADFRRIEHPYFTRVRDEGTGQCYLGTFSAAKHWFLREHRLLGKPTFPSTVYLELARSAATLAGGDGPIELRDMFFLAPFAVPEGGEKDLELLLEKDERPITNTSSRSAAGRTPRSAYVEHCRGRIASSRSDSSGTRHRGARSAVQSECDREPGVRVGRHQGQDRRRQLAPGARCALGEHAPPQIRRRPGARVSVAARGTRGRCRRHADASGAARLHRPAADEDQRHLHPVFLRHRAHLRAADAEHLHVGDQPRRPDGRQGDDPLRRHHHRSVRPCPRRSRHDDAEADRSALGISRPGGRWRRAVRRRRELPRRHGHARTLQQPRASRDGATWPSHSPI